MNDTGSGGLLAPGNSRAEFPVTIVTITFTGKRRKMDSETFTSDLEYLASSGIILSVETRACIRSSLITLQKEHKFRRIKLWGIIKGIQKDYYIVQGVGKNELTDRKALYR